MEHITKIFDLAEIEYIKKDFSGYSVDENCTSLYFFEDGRKINKNARENYEKSSLT